VAAIGLNLTGDGDEVTALLDYPRELAITDDLERDVRLRFMRIDAQTSALLREFWPTIETALSDILQVFIGT
jgi:hypothetical protein